LIPGPALLSLAQLLKIDQPLAKVVDHLGGIFERPFQLFDLLNRFVGDDAHAPGQHFQGGSVGAWMAKTCAFSAAWRTSIPSSVALLVQLTNLACNGSKAARCRRFSERPAVMPRISPMLAWHWLATLASSAVRPP
jgi:hypothetical protein